MKDKLMEESLEDVDVSFEVERKSDAGIAKNIVDDGDESDESYESYVPDSLRDFLKAADKQLEADLSFLSPPAPKNVLKDIGSSHIVEDDEDEGNAILANDLEREMNLARQKDLERQAAMKQEEEDRKEREQTQMDQMDIVRERKKQLSVEKAARAEAAMVLDDDDDDDDDNDIDDEDNVCSPLLDICNPSADVTKSHLKRIAMEGADDGAIKDEEEAEEHLASMVSNQHLPSPTIHNDMALVANGPSSAFSPSPSKVGRKLQMELDAEAHRASLSKQNNVSVDHSAQSALQEKQKSVQEKQQRLKELQSRSIERKRRLKALDDKAAERNSVEIVLQNDTPMIAEPELTTAAAAAADQAAAVAANAKPPSDPPKIRNMDHLTGPVKALPPHMRPTKNSQKWSFRARDAVSPPRPKEIITHVNLEGDGRSVSPLAHEQTAVSPLASPQTNSRQFRKEPVRRHQPTTSEPVRPSPSKRRQLTQPSSAFDHLYQPTVSSRRGKSGDARNATKVNPEEEQRKARARVRSRMAAQRRKAKMSNGNSLTSPPNNNNNMISSAKQKADARRQQLQKQEEERVAKLKAKIAEREAKAKKAKEARNKEEARKRMQQKNTIASQKQPPAGEQGERKVTRPPQNRGLTIPVAPRFATERRSTAKKPPIKKERKSLASITQSFGKGLRASTPPPTRSATSEPRRLTIPMAPKFSTSSRLGEKATPITSPKRKGREPSDTVSWSSQLRDVSGIASPVSRAASSIKTGPLTIPITPNFQPIRKRPLPKSTAEREKEQMEYFHDHPFKARMVKMNEPLTTKSRSKKPTPQRKLTRPEPFTFKTSNSRSYKRGTVEIKEEEVKPFKAKPIPNHTSKKSTKKVHYQIKPLTTPEPFRFATSSRERTHFVVAEEPPNEAFKARPMPAYNKSDRKSFGNRVASPRELTTPIPFNFHSTSSRQSYSKSEEEETDVNFKARPMPDFQKASQEKLTSPPTRPLTTPIPFKMNTNRTRVEIKQEETDKSFKARRMPNFERTSPLTQQEIQRAKNRRSTGRPTGASGLLFHRSFTTSSRLSRPRVVPEPPEHEIKPFKARPMPDFIPDVIVTRTPIKDSANDQPSKQGNSVDDDLDDILADVQKFQTRRTPNEERIERLKRHVRTPSKKELEDERESSFVFKASPAPKNMLDDPKIPVRRRDPKKLRSPDSVKRPSAPQPSTPDSTFKARPLPESTYDEPAPVPRSSPSPSPIRKIGSPDRFSAASPSRSSRLSSPAATPPRFDRENNSIHSNNVMEDAKARLRERLSKRKTNSAAVKAATPNRDKSKSNVRATSPLAFSTLRVQSRLNSQSQANAEREERLRKDSPENSGFTENTPRKSNSRVPKSIDLPSAEKPTPKINNNQASPEETSSFHTADEAPSQIPEPPDPRDAALLKETKLALALGIPDGDESSSILQLARDVQKAAEDELSFYGSVDTRDHWSSSLADGKPRSLLD